MSKVEGRAKAGQAPQVSRKCVSGGDQAPRVALPGDDPDVRHLAALADDRAAGERVLGPWRPQEVDRDVDDPRHNRDVGLDQKLHHRGVFEQRADDAAWMARTTKLPMLLSRKRRTVSSPSPERQLGRQVSGVMAPGGNVDWSFGRKRGLGI